MVKFINRSSMADALSFITMRMSVDSVLQNVDFISPITQLAEKLKGNDDYRDITTAEIDEVALSEAISRVYNGENVMVMVLKSDKENRIAFVFDHVPTDADATFADEFERALRGVITFSKAWMEDKKNNVYILQL